MPTPFQLKVYKLCRQIPRGKVSTYKELGNALGGKGQIYRAVGAALNKNPYGAWGRVGGVQRRSLCSMVPCHRVVNSNGTLGGFAHGSTAKIKLLNKEGIKIIDGKIVDFEKKLFTF